MVYQLGDNDADGIAAACAEIYGKYVGLVVMLARIGMDKVTCFLADVRIVFQRPRHSGGETFSARAISLMVICGLFMV